MDPLDFGRWQFGITTVYHFFMVPLTLGLGLVVTYLYICYVRTKKDEYKRMTKFWGKLYLINFAMGVATGLVQEFQFGMAWILPLRRRRLRRSAGNGRPLRLLR